VIRISYGFFDDDQGNKSSIRLFGFIVLVAAIVWSTIAVVVSMFKIIPGRDLVLFIISAGFACAFAPKVVQKIIGRKWGINGENGLQKTH